MEISKTVRLNHGSHIPVVGLGTWKLSPGTHAQSALHAALEAGYEHIDTATLYGNEEDVGKAIAEWPDVFVTTKLWNSDHGNVYKACEASLHKLGRIDLYLIHWPMPERLKTWKFMEQLFKEEKVRAIGVSNFTIAHLQELLKVATIPPAVNQVEFHPFLYQKELLDFCTSKGIAVQAYSPLTQAKKMKHPVIVEVAKKYGKSEAQVLIRWSLQHGLICLPKSSNPARIKENIKVFDFALRAEDMKKLDSLNENLHFTWDPSQFP